MQKSCAIALLLFLPFLINAQSGALKIAGHITNDAGEALPGASVFINDSIRLTGGVDGLFQYNYTDALPVSVVARFVGHFPLLSKTS